MVLQPTYLDGSACFFSPGWPYDGRGRRVGGGAWFPGGTRVGGGRSPCVSGTMLIFYFCTRILSVEVGFLLVSNI
jgi:hypothetical protein